MSAVLSKRVTAIACDKCDEVIETDGADMKEALLFIGAVESYGTPLGSWAHIKLADQWDQDRHYWRPGGMADLCPRCLAAENRKRLELQGRRVAIVTNAVGNLVEDEVLV